MGNTGLRKTVLKRVYRLILCHPISFTLVLGIAIGVLVLAWIPWGCPSDQRIRDQFTKHATEFSEMKEMILRDKGVSWVSDDQVGHYYLWSGKWYLANETFEERQVLEDVGLTEERYHHYLDLLRKTGAMNVARMDGEVRFAVYARGLAVAGSLKSIAYCEEPPSPLVDDTDAAEDDAVAHEYWWQVYAHIYGKWYILNSWE